MGPQSQRLFSFLAFLIILASVIQPACAIPWCGQQDLFFLKASSDIAGYEVLANKPELGGQESEVAVVKASTSPQLIGQWVTNLSDLNPGPNPIIIEPTLWRFRGYFNVDSAVGVTTVEYKVYNRSAAGVDQNLFFGSAITKELDGTTGATEVLTSYVRRNYTTIQPGERLVIKAYASTTSTVNKTVTMYTMGNNNATMVQMGYFDCPGITDNKSTSGSVGSDIISIIGVGVFLCFIALLIIKRRGL